VELQTNQQQAGSALLAHGLRSALTENYQFQDCGLLLLILDAGCCKQKHCCKETDGACDESAGQHAVHQKHW
jgi:hypothetical protein